MTAFTHKLKHADGAEIAEAALVLPVVFVFLLGIIWFGRAFNIYSTIQQAAQQGAVVASRPLCATCGTVTCSAGATNFPCDGTVFDAISGVMKASSLDPAQISVNSNPPSPYSCVDLAVRLTCPPTGNVSICRQALLNSPPSPGQTPQCGTIVSFQYPFQFYLPFTSLNLRQVTLTAQAQSRMEN
jgi:TadE-like protein